MLKIAIIPNSEYYEKGKLFDSRAYKYTRDFKWIKLQNRFKSHYQFGTIDQFSDLNDVDFFIFERIDTYLLSKIYNILNKRNLICIHTEPVVVSADYSHQALKKNSKYFKFTLTWDDDLFDEKKFKKFSMAKNLELGKQKTKKVDFEKKRLLTQI